MLLPFIAGLGTGWQQAVNGQVRVVAESALTATFINFAVGTTVLVVLMLVRWGVGGMPQRLPAEPWLYIGGALGCVFIGVTALLVRITGVLLLGLATVAGQLAAALLLDLLLPTAGHQLAFSTIGGTLLAIVAVAIASVRWRWRRTAA
nr:DMT family transporter [Leifsonia sp. C5G2]